MTELSRDLLHWYDEHGRDLPWRKTKDPYRIWVSEIMLQQTRVEAVLEKYKAFVERFPSIAEVACAEENSVLGLWQGLGYYSRARRLWQACVVMAREMDGRFPKEYKLFRALPGVGEYTANAVFSIAFSEQRVALDGNLARVGARLFAVAEDISKSSVRRMLTANLSPHVRHSRPGDMNQALMDLGSRVCVPRAPRCSLCPIVRYCEGCASGVAGSLPVLPGRPDPKPFAVTVYWLQDQNGAVFLRKREQGQFLQGLWELPWQEEQLEAVAEARPVYGDLASDPGYFHEYVFSHKHWKIHLEESGAESVEAVRALRPEAAYTWCTVAELPSMPIATVFRQILEKKLANQ